MGSRDRSISIWLTNYSRPLCVIRDLFDNPIMDLSWSKSPNPGLLTCSMDGTVSYIEFDYKEIGYPLTSKEREEFFMKKYNCDVNETVCLKPSNLNQHNQMPMSSMTTKKVESIKLVENLDILLAQEQKTKSLALVNENSVSQSPFNNSFTNNATTPSKLAILNEVSLKREGTTF